jgi:hypothetical protein
VVAELSAPSIAPYPHRPLSGDDVTFFLKQPQPAARIGKRTLRASFSLLTNLNMFAPPTVERRAGASAFAREGIVVILYWIVRCIAGCAQAVLIGLIADNWHARCDLWSRPAKRTSHWATATTLKMEGSPMTTEAMIRPALHSLRERPTLFQVAEAWGKLELKLETNDTRYWITTEGVPQKTSGAPINYVIDYVTVEKLSADGNWDLKAVYSPEAWKLSQGFDYCQLLQAELDRLQQENEVAFSWDRVRQIEEVERELQQANRIVAMLSDKVRARWSE